MKRPNSIWEVQQGIVQKVEIELEVKCIDISMELMDEINSAICSNRVRDLLAYYIVPTVYGGKDESG